MGKSLCQKIPTFPEKMLIELVNTKVNVGTTHSKL